MTILVMSCDRYSSDTFEMFHHCIEKYWPNHPEVYYCTETVDNPYYKTFKVNYPVNQWTRRLNESLKQIDDRLVLVCPDDTFFRKPVNDEVIQRLCSFIDNKLIAINLEPPLDGIQCNEILTIRNPKGKYLSSMMPQIWNREKLIELTEGQDKNPREAEHLAQDTNYSFGIIASDNLGIDFGKKAHVYPYAIVEGKWAREMVDFCEQEQVEIDFDKLGFFEKVKPCFGIVSYFPWEQPERKQRQDRLDRLIKQLSTYWPEVPIIIIAQQWKFYNPSKLCKNRIIRYDYPKLGILGARQELRKKFLESGYDYLIMFDDDAIIQIDKSDAPLKYMEELDKNPHGFCFIKGNGSSPYTEYNDSQLNLCAISRWIYEREPIPNIDPQQSQAFEDRIWSTLLHFKYADVEFDAPPTIRCIHFKNEKEPVPSTWASEKAYKWKQMRQNTKDIEAYIAEHKELPEEWKI